MARKIVRLDLDNLADLPVACQGCVFWELDPVARSRAAASGEGASEKQAWVSRVLLEWGTCGHLVYVDGEPAGYVLYAPPVFLPGSASFPTAPVSPDAVLLAKLHVSSPYDGQGLGRILMQTVVKDLLQRGDIRAVEAFGSRRTTDCVIPTDFLLRVGFKTHRAHSTNPRLRLELKSVLTWREEVEVALAKLLGVVGAAKPARKPAQSR